MHQSASSSLLLSHTTFPRPYAAPSSSSSSSSSSHPPPCCVSHYLSKDGRRLVVARSSADGVTLFDGRHQAYHHLDFWQGFPSITAEERKSQGGVRALRVRGSTAETEGSSSEQVLILAALGQRLVVWSSASVVSTSTKAWRVHSTLSLSEDIWSIDWHADKLLLGVGDTVQLWSMAQAGGLFWRRRWSKRGPGAMSHVEFNATGTSFAACAREDRRIAVWHVSRGREPVKGGVLMHPTEVRSFRWRGMPSSTSQSDGLVSLAADGVARIWAPVIDQPTRLRLSATVDPWSLGRTDSPSTAAHPPQPVFYLDAAPLTAILSSNIALLQRDVQLAEASSGDQPSSSSSSQRPEADLDRKRTRLKRLQHLLEDTPDMFLRFNEDGSLVVRAVAHVDRRPPTLLQAFTVLKIFPTAAVLPPAVARSEWTHCELLPMATQLGQSHEAPLAMLQLQSSDGASLSVEVNPALLFDGQEVGLAAREGNVVPGHGSDIVSLLGTEDGETAITIDEAGHAVEWTATRRPRVAEDGSREGRWTLQGRRHPVGRCAVVLAEGSRILAATKDKLLAWQSSRLVLFSGNGEQQLQGLEAQEKVVHGGINFSFVWVLTDAGRSICWRLDDLSRASSSSRLADEPLSIAFSTSSSNVGTMSPRGCLRIWQQDTMTADAAASWTCQRVLETGLQNASLGAASSSGMVALAAPGPDGQHRLEIWDTVGSEFSSARQLALDYAADDTPVAMNWLETTNAAAEGTEVLAVATSKGRIEVFAKRRPSMLASHGQDATATSAWRVFATFDVTHLGNKPITGLKWASKAGALLVACGQSLHLVGPLTITDASTGARAHLLEQVALGQCPLPSYHPNVLLQCMLWGKLDAARRVVADLARAVKHVEAVEDLALREEVPDLTIEEILDSQDGADAGKAGRKQNGSAHQSLFDDGGEGATRSAAEEAFGREIVTRLNAKLGKLGRLPEMAPAEVEQLILVIKCLLEVTEQGRALDDNGLRYLVSLRSFLNKPASAAAATAATSSTTANGITSTPSPQSYSSLSSSTAFESPRLRHRDYVYALHSTCQEPLLSLIQASYSSKLPWPIARSTGLFLWLSSPTSIATLAEQVARDEFMSPAHGTGTSDRDPIPCSLFYYALGKHRLVLNLWRQAAWHPEQKKMLRFLANDFTEERWKSAALKNAYALLSQRRFVFAASFFLLADSLADAVNVCVRNLGDVHLAIALCRIREEGRFDGPVLTRLLKGKVLPMVFERGYRWLGHWTFWALKARDVATRVLVSPLSEIRDDPRVVALLGSSTSNTSSSLPSAPPPPPRQEDVSLAIFFAELKQKTVMTAKGSREVSPQKEWGFVLHMNRTLRAMGCHVVGLALLAGWDFDAPELVVPQAQETKEVNLVEDAAGTRASRQQSTTAASQEARPASGRTDADDLFAALAERPASPPLPPPGSGSGGLLHSAPLTEEPDETDEQQQPSLAPANGTGNGAPQRRTSRGLDGDGSVTSPPTSPSKERASSSRPAMSPTRHRRRSSLMMAQHRRRSMINDVHVGASSEQQNGESPASATADGKKDEGKNAAEQQRKYEEAAAEDEKAKKKAQGTLMKATTNAAQQGAQDFDFSNFGF